MRRTKSARRLDMKKDNKPPIDFPVAISILQKQSGFLKLYIHYSLTIDFQIAISPPLLSDWCCYAPSSVVTINIFSCRQSQVATISKEKPLSLVRNHVQASLSSFKQSYKNEFQLLLTTALRISSLTKAQVFISLYKQPIRWLAEKWNLLFQSDILNQMFIQKCF